MTPPEEDALAPPPRGDGRLPEQEHDDPAEAESSDRSLLEDMEALIADGRTYLEAELGYQKTRALFVAEQAKSAAVFGAVAALLALLALIGLVMGLIIALTPILGPWGAGGIVVLVLVVAALLAGRAAAQRWKRLMAAIDSQPRGE